MMPQWVIGAVFAVIAVAAAYGALTSISSGRARDDIYSASADERPIVFIVLVLAKLTVLAISTAVVLHAAGLIAMDPMAEMKNIFDGNSPGLAR